MVESPNGELYLVPNFGRQILKKSKKSMEFKFNKKLYIDSQEVTIKRSSINFENYDVWGDKIVLFPRFGNDLFFWGDDGMERLAAKLNDKVDVYSEKRADVIKGEMYCDILYEGTSDSLINCSLIDYMNAVSK